MGDIYVRIYKIKNGHIEKCTLIEKIAENEKIWAIMEPTEIYQYVDILGINKQTIEECNKNIDMPKLDVYDEYNFGLLHVIDKNIRKKEVSKINFYISKEYLIFVANESIDIIQEVEKNILDNTEQQFSIDKILYMLMDRLTHNDMLMLEAMEEEIEKAEELVIKGAQQNYTKIIIDLRKQLLFLRKHYEPLCDVVEELEQNSNNILAKHSLPYFRILTKRINRLDMRVTTLRDYVTQIREAYDAQIDIRLNKIMKIFTVITAIFLPLTLIVGWYGMNFQNMPELTWQYVYVYVIILSIIVFIISIMFFKRKNFF